MSSSRIINHNEVRVIGMSRSGSHAIINWILRQWQGRTCFLNCVEAGRNPFATCRPLGHVDDAGWRASFAGFSLEAERAGRFSHKDLLIYNYEDSFLGPLERQEAAHEEWVGPSAQRLDVLVLRDPFNLFASRLKSGYGGVSGQVAMRMWKQHAREFLGLRRRLRRHRRLCISYNRWACDAGYRRLTAQALGLAFTDEGFETVPPVARGSSFDGLAFDGVANRMRVNERWRHFMDDASYVELFDAEAVQLSRMAFGEVCKVQVVLRPGALCASGAPLNRVCGEPAIELAAAG